MGYEIYRKLDKLGRLCIPADFRRYFDIYPNDAVKLVLTEKGILIQSLDREYGDE